MVDHIPAVSTGAKDFGRISDNRGAVIGDVSGPATVIGLGPIRLNNDLATHFNS